MAIGVQANVRTAHAAENSLNAALTVAFASGGVMGLSVVCTGMLGLIIIYSIWGGNTQDDTLYLAGFGFGASSIALFARVGGGIYTKAADVGAGKVFLFSCFPSQKKRVVNVQNFDNQTCISPVIFHRVGCC